MACFDDIVLLNSFQVIAEAEMQANKSRRFFDRKDPFDLSDTQFVKTYRLSKELAMKLIEILGPLLNKPSRKSAIDVQTKVLTTLNFLGTGSYQYPVASHFATALSQPTVSRIISEVVDALNHTTVFGSWVKFPSSIMELDHLRTAMYDLYGFPGVIGIIDCTHVAIVSPPTTLRSTYDERSYVNRKNYHSINVQLICDHDLRIRNVNARFPGSSHDCFVFNNSAVKTGVVNLYNRGYKGYYLIGDSGYALRPWMMIPVSKAVLNDQENRYNKCFKSVRSTIERCNGLLKTRFRCLLKHRALHYDPLKAGKIVNACVVLHNMCIDNKELLPIEASDIQFDFSMEPDVEENAETQPRTSRNPMLEEGRKLQNQIINSYF